jgi:signal transduction histidine kinase
MVALEPAFIGQILDGLLSNAIKFSSSGGQIVLRVEKTPERQVVVAVRSPGAVLDAKDTTRIFEESYRPDPARAQRFGGLGIRLSLIKDILTRHGGKIWVEIQPGKGVIFSAALPLARG